MTNMQAAIGVAQLERLDEFVVRKRKMGEQYIELLKDTPGLQLPQLQTTYSKNIFWVFGIILNESLGINAEYMINKLNTLGIGTRPFFYPMHQQPILKSLGFFESLSLPNSERMYKQGLYLPSGLALTESQINRVSKILKKAIEI
jgi:perosamine synthetase